MGEGENKHHRKGGGWTKPHHPERRRRRQHHPRKRNNTTLHLDIWWVSGVFQGWPIILSMCSPICVCVCLQWKLLRPFWIARLTLQTRKLWLVGVATDRDARQAYLRFFAFYLFLLLFFFASVSFNERFLLFFVVCVSLHFFVWPAQKNQKRQTINEKEKWKKKKLETKNQRQKKKRPPKGNSPPPSRDGRLKIDFSKEMLQEIVQQLRPKRKLNCGTWSTNSTLQAFYLLLL